MSYQLAVSALGRMTSNSDQNTDGTETAEQLHKLLVQYCQQLKLSDSDSHCEVAAVASADELMNVGQDWTSLQVSSLKAVPEAEHSILGCIIFYPTYSTWVGGRVRLGAVQCDSSLQSNQHLIVSLLRSVIDRTLDDEDLQRIELLHPASDSSVYEQLVHLGFQDLTKTEDWHFARLDEDGLRKLADRQPNSGISIRPGSEADCAEVISMIRSLAEFEKLSDQVRINEDQLRRDIFGERRFAKVLIAESTNSLNEVVTIGYGLAFDEFWHSGRGVCLEDVFVKPDHRGKGVCSALFSAVAKDALTRGCHFMSLCYLAWNSSAFDVYRHYGFVDITNGEQGFHFLRLTRDQYRSALCRAI